MLVIRILKVINIILIEDNKFNKTDLKTLLLPIPPLNEQIRIIQQIESLFDLLSKIEYSIK